MDMSGDGEDFGDVLSHLLQPSNRRDPRAVRLAAATAALIETVNDRRHSDDGGGDVKPAELFLTALMALQGTLSNADATEQDLTSTQSPLLEVLRVVVTHASISSPAVYASQFCTLGRTLRATTTVAVRTQDATESSGGLGGINALLRQVCRTSTACLLALANVGAAADSSKIEKDALRLFHVSVMGLFDDSRPKVRREAHGSALELIAGSKFAPGQILEYSTTILESFIGCDGGNGDGRYAKGMHLLSFLEQAMPVLPFGVVVVLGENLIRLVAAVASRSVTTDADSNANRMVAFAFTCLVAAVERENQDSAAVQFSSRVLASMLQLNMQTQGRKCRPAFARCLVSCCAVLLESKSDQAPSIAVATKLMPLVATRLVELSETDESVAETVCAELTRWNRSCLSAVASRSLKDSASIKSIGGCIEAVGKMMHHRFRHNWETCLPVVSGAVVAVAKRHDGEGSKNEGNIAETKSVIGSTVKGLVQLRSDVNDEASRRTVESSVAMIIEGVGIETFLGIVSLDKCDETELPIQQSSGAMHLERAWLLSVLKSASASGSIHSCPNLAFFQGTILSLARKCDAASASPSLTAAEAAVQKARVLELWDLLPSFCSDPCDIELTFPTLSKTLIKAMTDQRYPELVSIIPSSLRLLASGVHERKWEQSNARAERDYEIVEASSVKLLPALFKLVETLHGTNTADATTSKKSVGDMDIDSNEGQSQKDSGKASRNAQRVQAISDAIAELARICPQQFCQNLFKKIMQRLLVAIQSEEENSDKICTLLGLAQALVSSQSLDESSIFLLYRAIRPLIQSDEHDSRVQKRAYKVMAMICEKYGEFVTSSERLEEMTELMIASIMTCHVSSRHMRLKCMAHIVGNLDSSNEEHTHIIPKIMGEVLLCLKDSNGKTREASYQLLIKMAEKRDDMVDFFQIVLAALGAQTSHMRSGAVMALSRLVFEYAREDETVQELLPQLLQTVIVLFAENSREVTKSVVGFVRVSIAAMRPEQLEPLLPEVIGGLMKYGKGMGRLRSKIKIILKKLARTYSFEKIAPLVPEDDSRLITHMRKLSERAARRKAAGQADGQADGQTVFDDMMESDEEDSDDGRTLMTGATGFTRMTAMTGKSLRSAALSRADMSVRSMAKSAATAKSTSSAAPRIKTERGGEVLDMLDPSVAKSVHFANDVTRNEFSDDDDDDDDDGVMEFDDMGRLVVSESADFVNRGIHIDESNGADELENNELGGGGKRRRISKFEAAKVERAESIKKKSQKKQNEPKALGAAFKSKRAGGDVKKKGQKFEPYAFVPLDGKSYSKKNRGNAVAQMSTVVRDKSGKRKRR